MRNVTKFRRTATAVAAATAAGMLLAGCATTVSGSAQIGTGQPGTVVSAPDTGSTAGTVPSSGGSPSSDSPSPSTAEGSSPPATSDGQGTSSPPDSSSSRTSGPAAGNDPSVYPTKPLQIEKNPSSAEDKALAEARRLAAYVSVPSAIDPKFSEGGNISTLPFKGPSALQILFTDPVPTVAQRAGMYTGFSSARGTVDHSGSLLTAAFVFSNAAARRRQPSRCRQHPRATTSR